MPGRGLGNRAITLWHRTVGFSCSLLFPRSADPPPLGAGGDLGILATPTVTKDCVTPFFSLFFGGINSTTYSRPAPPFQVIWRWFSLTFVLSLTDRRSFCPLFLDVSCRLGTLAVQRCGSGF